MSTIPLVVVTSSYDFPVDEQAIAETLRGNAQYKVIDLPFAPLSRDEEDHLIEHLQGAEALFVRPGIITQHAIQGARQLRIIAVHGAGVDQVDVAAATDAGVVVTNVPGGNSNAVAELTIGLLLALVRRIPQTSWMVQHEGKWNEARWKGTELRGKTIGVVGCGHVGRLVIALARAFGMTALGYDALVPAEVITSAGAVPTALADLLGSSDVVTTHVPLTVETRHLIGEAQLARMKQGAILINTSRGGVVDGNALYESLHSGHLGGAALDVMELEPPPRDSPILALANVVVTPHMAGSTGEVLTLLARTMCEDILRVLQGHPPLHPVNPEVLSRLRPRAVDTR